VTSPSTARCSTRDGTLDAGSDPRADGTQVRYLGTIHDFALLNPITQTPAPRAAIAQAGEFLRRVLHS
jgi:hypothetical protein